MTKRQPLILDSSFVTVPISEGASAAIQNFMRLHAAELNADLEPFGLTIADIAVPTFERLVYADVAPAR